MTTALQDLNQIAKDLGAAKVMIVSGDANNPVFQNGISANRLILTSNVAVQIPALTKSFQAVVTGTGAVSAIVSILISNNDIDYTEVAILAPSGTDRAHDEIPYQSSYVYTKAVISNLTGTGATCVVTVGY